MAGSDDINLQEATDPSARRSTYTRYQYYTIIMKNKYPRLSLFRYPKLPLSRFGGVFALAGLLVANVDKAAAQTATVSILIKDAVVWLRYNSLE